MVAHRYLQDQKVRLYSWDGKSLKETGLLENNKGSISALAFSPDGSLLAAGDVSHSSPGSNKNGVHVTTGKREGRFV